MSIKRELVDNIKYRMSNIFDKHIEQIENMRDDEAAVVYVGFVPPHKDRTVGFHVFMEHAAFISEKVQSLHEGIVITPVFTDNPDLTDSVILNYPTAVIKIVTHPVYLETIQSALDNDTYQFLILEADRGKISNGSN